MAALPLNPNSPRCPLEPLPEEDQYRFLLSGDENDFPVVEATINDFNGFVVNFWYSLITPDKEAPGLIHAVIMDILSEISVRIKEINIVDLLTRIGGICCVKR